MPLIKQGVEIVDDWQPVPDDAPLPAEGKVVISLARWQAERDMQSARDQLLGLSLPNTADVAALGPDVPHFALIVLHFPKFSDGRAYSQARILRERLGYRGELRATGNVLRDQLLYMHRAGFDAFEIPRPDALAVFQAALGEMRVFYQPTGDGRRTALQQRLQQQAVL